MISGCSGGGKSTLLSELANRGYLTVPEAGRQIVQEQMAIHGDGLPWSNLQKFRDLVLSRYLYYYNFHLESKQPIFFDRGIIDVLPSKLKPDYFLNAAQIFRYHRVVFLVPPWEEIFAEDQERKHDFSFAKKEFDELLAKYKHFKYETVLIPKVSVQKRASFVFEKLGF